MFELLLQADRALSGGNLDPKKLSEFLHEA